MTLSALLSARCPAALPLWRGLSSTAVLAGLFSLVGSSSATAQYPDARLVPNGVMRISFEPQYFDFRDRFDVDGNIESLGTDFSDSTGGSRLFPALRGPELAVRSIIGDPTYVMNVGAVSTTLDTDIRNFPLNLQFGLTDWLTVTASLPLVTTRAQVDFSLDSTTGTVGWNQIAAQAGNVLAFAEIQALLGQLEAGAAFVESEIAAGGYGCPTGPACADAQDVVVRVRQLKMDLTELSGVGETGGAASQIPSFVPLSSSAAGQAIVNAIVTLSTELVSLGASAITSTFPLPSGRIGADDVNAMLGDSVFGYGADPLEFVKYRQKLGDAELGVRVGLLRRASLRAVVSGTVRLPTGQLDEPDNYVDIGTGDRQTDIEFGLEAYWQPSPFLALATVASYNLQLGHQLERRATSHEEPLAPLRTQVTVTRHLGDEFRAGLFPSLRLSETFTVYGSALYSRKPADRFTLVDPSSSSQAGDPSLLEFETAQQLWSFGGGVFYRAAEGRGGPALPIEAGIDYRAALRGSGGMTPKAVSLNFYLRLFWRWFGGEEQSSVDSSQSTVPNG